MTNRWRAMVVVCVALSMCACRTPFGSRSSEPGASEPSRSAPWDALSRFRSARKDDARQDEIRQDEIRQDDARQSNASRPDQHAANPTTASSAMAVRSVPASQPATLPASVPVAPLPGLVSGLAPPPASYSLSDEDEVHSASDVRPASAQMPVGTMPHVQMPLAQMPNASRDGDYIVRPVQWSHGAAPAALPEMAYTGAPPEMVPSAACPAPYPQIIHAPEGQWQPDGLPCPWPPDEYIYDGGDRRLEARVQPNWDVNGLDQEDTILHYDTLEGETVVQPSNRVKIYAPRFAAVRKVTGAVGFQIREHIAGATNDAMLVQQNELTVVGDVMQPLQPGRNVGLTTTPSFRDTTRGLQADRVQGAIRFDADLKPYEDFLIVRRGQYDVSEKARLANSLQAAVAWTDNVALQVVIGEEIASVIEGDAAAQSTYVYETGGKPRLRICKLASKADAAPGELVEFTIRFDNIGEQVVGNVTIIDSLTTRLEYVDETQVCNLKSNFMTQENEGESLVLRWEIVDPLPVGEGGVIRFKCRVR